MKLESAERLLSEFAKAVERMALHTPKEPANFVEWDKENYLRIRKLVLRHMTSED